MQESFLHSARTLNVHLMLIGVAAVGCFTTSLILPTSNQFSKSIANAEDFWFKFSRSTTASSIHWKWFGVGQNSIISLIHHQQKKKICIEMLLKHLTQSPSPRCEGICF